MSFKVVLVPADELWGCLQCEMNLGREVNATMLLKEGEPGKPGVVSTGVCGNHAEIMDVEDLREAQRRFAEVQQ